MNLRILSLGTGLVLLGVSGQAAWAQDASIGQAARAEALQLAGTDPLLNRVMVLCDPNPDRNAVARQQDIPPARIFDNLYFLGNKGVSAWLWQWPDGFVLIDTLSGPEEAEANILNSLSQFGIAPERIKLIIITHGHFDHSGGAEFLRNKLPAARFAMTEQTYRVAAQTSGSKGTAFPKNDLVLKDGMRLPGGLRVYETLGHSPGTTSLIFPVRLGSTLHMASLLGGSSSYRLSGADLVAYSNSTRRFASLAETAGVDYVISNHQAIDSTRAWIDALGKGGHPAPMLHDEVQAYYRTVDLCARSYLGRVPGGGGAGQESVWHHHWKPDGRAQRADFSTLRGRMKGRLQSEKRD